MQASRKGSRIAEVDVDVVYPASKRALDRCVATLLLLVLAPVFAVALGALWLDRLGSVRDRGPLLYREQRISRGRAFELLKFRTLRRDVLAARGDGEAHARLLEANPENLTWTGRRVLKPWYLDELPQLVNVLRGDMSLVGPRPWPRSMVEHQVASGHDYRLHVPAGWTGPAQVQKGITDPSGYTDLDLAYVEACKTWSGARLVLHDLAILWRTVKVLARGEGLQY
ncbi:MAG TPA: sugar transferase [Gaiellaceae bacterium]|nr:sugar transferase [Gaiellaceae bacterium]